MVAQHLLQCRDAVSCGYGSAALEIVVRQHVQHPSCHMLRSLVSAVCQLHHHGDAASCHNCLAHQAGKTCIGAVVPWAGGCDGAQGCSCFPPRLLTLAVALRQRWGAASHHGSAAGFRAPLQHIVQLVCCHLDNVLAAVAPQKQWRLWDAAGGCDGPVPRRVVAGLQVGVAKGTAWRVAVNWEPGAPHRNTSID